MKKVKQCQRHPFGEKSRQTDRRKIREGMCGMPCGYEQNNACLSGKAGKSI